VPEAHEAPAAHEAHAGSDKDHHPSDHGHGDPRTAKREVPARPADASAKRLEVGEKVQDLVVTDLAGKTWRLSDLQKRSKSGVVSLTFWCTFCHSCRTMESRLQKLAADFSDKAAVLGVDASAADSAKKVEDFTRTKQFTVPVFLDAHAEVADLFGVRLTTTTVVIDSSGVLRYRGRFDGQGISHAENALEAVLEGKEVVVKETAPAG
jgi:peroxiredoxin